MARRPHAPGQMNLLDWAPPEPVVRFPEAQVRAATLAGTVAKGVSLALKDSAHPRAEIARRMSDFLGDEVSKFMLDAYASEARADHIINVVRFVALVHATGDRRLLEMIAEMFGWSVIERRYLPLIELAAVRDQEDRLRRQREALHRQARAGGAL